MEINIKKCTPYGVSKKNKELFYSMDEMRDIVRSHGIPPSGLRKPTLYEIMVKIAKEENYMPPRPDTSKNLKKFNKYIIRQRRWVKVTKDGEDYYFLASQCYKEPKSNKSNLVDFYDKKKISEL